MYGIYTNIGGKLMVNVTIYSIHGSYGIGNNLYIYMDIFACSNFPKFQINSSGVPGLESSAPEVFKRRGTESLFLQDRWAKLGSFASQNQGHGSTKRIKKAHVPFVLSGYPLVI